MESTKPACDDLLGKEAMENRKVNHRLRDHNRIVRNQVVTHGQKARDMIWMVAFTFRRMDIYVSGPQVAPKVSIISPIWNLVNRMFSLWVVRSQGQAMTQTAEDVIKS